MRPRLVAWFLLLLILPMGILGSPGTLLCIGIDGHVAIEASSNGSCEGPDSTDHEEQVDCDSECGHTNSCCGDCVDCIIELEDGTSSQFSDKASFSVRFAPSIIHELVVVDTGKSLFVCPEQTRPPIPNLPLESFRTVRLLI